MRKYAKKAVYTYFRLSVRFKNDEESEYIKKFWHTPKKNDLVKKLLKEYFDNQE